MQNIHNELLRILDLKNNIQRIIDFLEAILNGKHIPERIMFPIWPLLLLRRADRLNAIKLFELAIPILECIRKYMFIGNIRIEKVNKDTMLTPEKK